MIPNIRTATVTAKARNTGSGQYSNQKSTVQIFQVIPIVMLDCAIQKYMMTELKIARRCVFAAMVGYFSRRQMARASQTVPSVVKSPNENSKSISLPSSLVI